MGRHKKGGGSAGVSLCWGISVPITDGWETLLSWLERNNLKYWKYLYLYAFCVAISHHTAVLLCAVTAVGIFLSVFSQRLSGNSMSWMSWVLPHFPLGSCPRPGGSYVILRISQIRLVPICKLEFNLVPELTGVFMAFMLGQRHGSGARERRAGPLLSHQVYPFWLGGVFIHCHFAPACLEALSSQALPRFNHAFWLCFLWSFLIH